MLTWTDRVLRSSCVRAHCGSVTRPGGGLSCVNPIGDHVTPSAAAGSSYCLSPGDNCQFPHDYASHCSLERLSPHATPHFLVGCSPPLNLACSVFPHHCAPHTICLLLACPQLRGSEPWTGLTRPTWASPQQPYFSEAYVTPSPRRRVPQSLQVNALCRLPTAS